MTPPPVNGLLLGFLGLLITGDKGGCMPSEPVETESKE